MANFQFRLGDGLRGDRAVGRDYVVRTVCRLPENDEYRTGGIEIQPHLGASVLGVPDSLGFNDASVWMPQFWGFSSHAKGAFGGIKLTTLV